MIQGWFFLLASGSGVPSNAVQYEDNNYVFYEDNEYVTYEG